MKKSFKLFIDSLDVLDELSDEEAGKLFKAIREYELNEKEVLTGLMKAVFTPFKNNLDRAKQAYDAVCEANKANGLKGGRPNRNKANGLKPNRNNPDKDKDKDINKKSEYENFLEQLSNACKFKTKVTKTKEGAVLFKSIPDKSKLFSDYINHQLEKDNYAVRITDYMKDYQTAHSIKKQEPISDADFWGGNK
jgi:hypothetical protein